MADQVPAIRPTTILLVEDDHIISLAQAALLGRRGFDVHQAYDGTSAIRMALDEALHVDVVLMDIDLGPGMGGTEAANQILSSRAVPVIFLTSHAERGMVERVRGITRYGYVLKSSGEFVLIQAIDIALELFAAQRDSELREERYEAMTNLTGEIITQTNLDGEWIYLNDKACEFFGETREQLVGRRFLDFVHPDDHGQTFASIDTIKAQQPIRGDRNRQLTPSGWRTIDWNSEVIYDRNGTMIGFQATGREVTEPSHLQTELRSSRELLQKVMEASPASVLVFDAAGRVTYANPSAALALGVGGSAAVGRAFDDPAWEITNANGDQIPSEEMPFAVVKATGRPVRDFEHTISRADGSRVLLTINAVPLFGTDGQFEGSVSVIEDVTDRRANEERLEQQDATLTSISANLPGMVYQFSIAPDGSMTWPFISASVERLSGYRAVEVQADPTILVQAVHPDDVEYYRTSLEESRSTLTQYSVVHRLVRADGAIIWLSAQSSPALQHDGSILWTGVAVDISAQVAAEERAQALLREKELLLGELSHRVKNDIGLIRALVEMQRDRLSNNEARDALGETLNRLIAIGQVYDGLHQTSSAGRVDVTETITAQVAMLRETTLPADAVVRSQIGAASATHRLAVSIGIIVNELLTNAAKYGAGNGRPLEIDLSLAASADTLEIVVTDNGEGFPTQVIDAGARGYGLSIVAALAAQHRGSIELENRGGAVATVRITDESDPLPRT